MSLAVGLLVARLIVGLGFAAHGTQKLFGWFGGYGIAGTGGFLESIGFRPGKFFAAAAGASELLGGLLIATGFLGGAGAMFVIATMLVATLSVHLKNGFFAQNQGYELPLVYGAAAATFAFTGYGPLSLDAALGVTLGSNPVAAWVFVGLGIAGGLANAALRKPAPAQPAAEA